MAYLVDLAVRDLQGKLYPRYASVHHLHHLRVHHLLLPWFISLEDSNAMHPCCNRPHNQLLDLKRKESTCGLGSWLLRSLASLSVPSLAKLVQVARHPKHAHSETKQISFKIIIFFPYTLGTWHALQIATKWCQSSNEIWFLPPLLNGKRCRWKAREPLQ